MNVKPMLALPICFVVWGCVSSPPLMTNDPVAQVTAAEKAFAKTMADRDHEAFSQFVADDAVFLAGKDRLRGKQAVTASWARFFVASSAPFSWEPDQVEILDSGLLAHSSGPVRDPEGNLIGRYDSIWRYEGAGVWKVIFDKGSEPCVCAAE